MEVYKVLLFAVIICGVQSAAIESSGNPNATTDIDKEPSGNPNASPTNRPPLHEECSGLTMLEEPCRNNTGICYWSPDRIGEAGHMECRGYCGNYIPSVDNAVVVVNVNINTTTEGGVLTFECAEGYAAPPGSQLNITCMCTGDWTPVGFQCVKNCGDLEVTDYFEHGVVEEDVGDHLEDGIVLVKCEDTYGQTEPNLFVQCVDGSWTPSSGECVKQCGTVNVAIDNASLLGTHDADIIDDRAVFVCDADYVALGDMWAVCKEPGVWELESGKCLKDCGNALNVNIDNVATVTVEDPTYEGSTHILQCAENFGSESGVSATCDVHGFWQVTGECIPDCGEPDVSSLIPNGEVMDDGTYNYLEGSIVPITCEETFGPSTPNLHLQCVNGSWQPSDGACVQQCGTVSVTIEHASVSGTYTDAIIGEYAYFECDPGYVAVGYMRAKCNDFGTWEVDNGQCLRDCGDELNMGVANVVPVTFDDPTYEGSTHILQCEENFGSESGVSATCDANGFWQVTGECIPDCGNSLNVDIANVATVTVEDPTYEGSTHILQCEENYGSESGVSATCDANGFWQVTGECIPDCGEPDVSSLIPNGEVMDDGTYNYLEGSIVPITCEDTFGPSTPNLHLQCVNGSWQPSDGACVQQCGTVSVTIEHASVSGTYTDAIIGEYALFECDPGYVAVGYMRAKCNELGTWEVDNGQCLRDCGDELNMGVANVVPVTFDDPTYEGSTHILQCEENFGSESGVSATCDANGFWQVTGECIPDCGNSLNVDIANVVPVTVEDPTYEGSTHILQCEENYGSESGVSATCDANGLWQVTGECIPDCGEPDVSSLIPNGEVMDDGTYNYLEGSIVPITCEDTFGPSTLNLHLQCVNGSWQPSDGACVQQCGTVSVTIEHASVSGTYTDAIIGEYALFECDPGYVAVGYMRAKCNELGTWEVDNGQCLRDCGDELNMGVANVVPVTFDDPTYEGSTHILQCEENFGSESGVSATCDANGFWKVTGECIPECVVLNVNIENATPLEEYADVLVGDIAFFQCKAGYTASGDMSAKCLESGSWELNDGKCVKDCSNQLDGSLGNFTSNTVNDPTNHGSIHEVQCANGFNSESAVTVTCDQGEWQICGQCQPLCVAAPNVTGASQESTGNIVGSTTTYTCTDSNTEFDTTCLETGEWSPTQGCPTVCVDAPSVTGASKVSTGITVGSTTTYTCTDSNTEFITTCLDSGVWSPTQECPTECGDPPAADYTVVVLTNDGTTATYSCNDNTVSGEVDVSEWTINCNSFVWEETPAICYPIDVTCVVSSGSDYDSSNGVAYRFRDYCYYPIQASQTFSKGKLACPDSATGSVMAIMEDEIEYNWFNELGAQTLGSRFWWAGLYWNGTSWLTYDDEEPPYIETSLTEPPTVGYCAVIDNKAVTSDANWISETCTANSDTFKVICKIPADTLENP